MANPRRRRLIKAARIAAVRAKRAGSVAAAPALKKVEAPAPMIDAPVVEEAPKVAAPKAAPRKAAPRKAAPRKSGRSVKKVD
jgi:hypothetical protein